MRVTPFQTNLTPSYDAYKAFAVTKAPLFGAEIADTFESSANTNKPSATEAAPADKTDVKQDKSPKVESASTDTSAEAPKEASASSTKPEDKSKTDAKPTGSGSKLISQLLSLGFDLAILTPLAAAWGLPVLGTLAVGLPILSRLVNAKFANNALTNAAEVETNAYNLIKRTVEKPLKLIPQIRNHSAKIVESTVVNEPAKFVAQKTPTFLGIKIGNRLIANVPKGIFNKIFHVGYLFLHAFKGLITRKIFGRFTMILSILGFLGLKSRPDKNIGREIVSQLRK